MILISLFGTSQNTYLKTIGTYVSDYGTSCIPMPDFGSVTTIAGGMSVGMGVQFGLVKTDYNGTIEWQKLYVNGTFALAKNVVRTSDGGLCVFGEVSQTTNSNHALFLLRTDSLGNELWSYRVIASSSDRPANIIACKSGGFLTCSINNYNTGGYPMAQLIRFDENGIVQWSKKYSAFQGVSPKSMIELPNGDFVFVSSVNAAFTGSFQHILLTRTNDQGNLLWSTMFYGDYDDEAEDLISTPDGELFIAGGSYRIGSEWDGFYLKTDSLGKLMSTVFYDGNTNNGEHFRSMAQLEDGNIVMLGDVGSFDQRNISLLKVNETGQIIWSREYPLSTNFTNYGLDFYVAHDQGFLVTGDVRPPNYLRDGALFKTNSEGLISCYTQNFNYTQDNTPLNEMKIYMAQIDDTLITQESILFTHPSEQITEKTVCEEQLPIVKVNHTQSTNCPYICFDFTTTALNNPTSWLWEFEGGIPTKSMEQHPNVCFNSIGNHTVKLTVSNSIGAVSQQQTISITEFDCPFPEIPNVFTPNKDGVNDLFEFPTYSKETILYIYNRWGNLVFVGEGQSLSWDGTTQQGLAATEGVYYYMLESNGLIKHGFLHLQK